MKILIKIYRCPPLPFKKSLKVLNESVIALTPSWKSKKTYLV